MSEALIGTVTIGQSPRTDVLPDFLEAVGQPVQLANVGALDGLSTEGIAALAPRPGECVLVTRLRDGAEVKLSEERVLARMEACVRELESRGVGSIALFCTGEFPRLTSRLPLLRPDLLTERLVSAFLPGGSLYVVVPAREQLSSITRKWTDRGFEVRADFLSPYSATMDDVLHSAERCARSSCDLILLDCIGYSKSIRGVFREIAARPVVLPRSLLGRIAGELLST
jgi:protein AroM